MDKLKFLNEQMKILQIPYAFMEWTDKVPTTYWIGEYSESPTGTEDGAEESTFILTGTTRGSWLDLEETKEKIKNHFPSVGGLRAKTNSGSIAVFYLSSIPVPTDVADLKRIQINLEIKEWKGIE